MVKPRALKCTIGMKEPTRPKKAFALVLPLLLISIPPVAAELSLRTAVQNFRRNKQAEVKVRVLGTQVVTRRPIQPQLRAAPARSNVLLELSAQDLP